MTAAIKFCVYGHKNLLGTHKTTLEFTKDSELTLKGDCIVGVRADFDLAVIREFSENKKIIKIIIKIKTNSCEETITAELNPGFDSGTEMVIRKSSYICKRTFAINADKAAADIDRRLIEELKDENKKAEVIISTQK